VQDKWIDFRRMAFELPDGTVFSPYYNFSRRSYVVIVASDEEGRYLCVRQFRPGLGKVTTEFPAGGIDRLGDRQYGSLDDPGQEDPLAAAKRELREETGYVSEDWKALLTVPSQATMADNYAYVFRARNCRRVDGQHLDEDEYLNVLLLSPEELAEAIDSGRFEQAVHIMAWAYDRLRDKA
jgi:ADP-ribose pyrophosphatase